MSLEAAVVDTLYRALLGRPADPAGAAHWAQVDSIEDVIAGFATTDEFATRMAHLSLMAVQGPEVNQFAALGLMAGDGLTSLEPGTSAMSAAALRAFPWSQLTSPGRSCVVRVIGPYSTALAAEIEQRSQDVVAHAGLGPASTTTHDILVLTESIGFRALRAIRNDVIVATRDRLLCPAPPNPTEPVLRRAALAAMRQALHDERFLEVTQSAGRRFGAADVDGATTHRRPESTLTSVRSADPQFAESMTSWFIAGRTASHER